MSARPWPEDVTARMCELWDAGRSGGEIAEIIGFGRSAVMGKIYRMYEAGHPFARERLANKARIEKRQFTASQRKPKHVSRTPNVPPRPRGNIKARAVARQQAVTVPVDIKGAKPWLERLFGECAYPIAGEGADTLSCCAKTPNEATYCLHHQAIVYVAPVKRETNQPGYRSPAQRRFAA